MATLQQDQAQIDLALVRSLTASVPKIWDSVILEAERVWRGPGDEGYRISIHGSEGDEHLQPSDDLMLQVRKLALVFQNHGHPWKKVWYKANRTADGGWDFISTYEY